MDPYISEIRIFAGTFAPRSWMLCQGQSLSIAEWTAVYALIGTMYGGDGVQSFNLPDLRGRKVVGTGQGPGLTPYDEGEANGTEAITISSIQMPIHNHQVLTQGTPNVSIGMKAFSGLGSNDNPLNSYIAGLANSYTTSSVTETMASADVAGTVQIGLAVAGGSQPLSIRTPFLGLNFIFCVEGIFPSRN